MFNKIIENKIVEMNARINTGIHTFKDVMDFQITCLYEFNKIINCINKTLGEVLIYFCATRYGVCDGTDTKVYTVSLYNKKGDNYIIKYHKSTTNSRCFVYKNNEKLFYSNAVYATICDLLVEKYNLKSVIEECINSCNFYADFEKENLTDKFMTFFRMYNIEPIQLSFNFENSDGLC